MREMHDDMKDTKSEDRPNEPRGPALTPWEEAEIEELRRRGAFKGPMKLPTVIQPLWH